MTRQDILNEYTVNDGGIIQNPGKFESEMLYAPYFYDAMLNGMGDETLADNSELFELSDEDRAMFPELGSDTFLVLSESDSGFVSVNTTDNDPRDSIIHENGFRHSADGICDQCEDADEGWVGILLD